MTTFTLLGHEVLGAKEGNTYYISMPNVEKLLNYEENRGRKKIASKQLEAFAGKQMAKEKTNIVHGLARYSAAFNPNTQTVTYLP